MLLGYSYWAFFFVSDVFIGVNIGTELSDMPHPTQVVALLKAQHIRHVRLYDADRGMLIALANTGIQVAVSVPNEQLLGIGQSNATAANWVSQNIVAHYPATNITTICVGSEVLSSLPNAAPVLVNALQYIHSALVASNLDRQVKVSTPLSTSVILDSFPPSQAFFNHSLKPIIVPMLKFLQSTNSYLMLNIYPYYDYMNSNGVIPLDYALFEPLPANKEAVDSNTLLHYTNVFDAMVDAAYFAMADLNFTHISIMVSETGWPSKGDAKEPDAIPENADTYNSNLIKHILNKTGTPKYPGVAVSTYIYELYNEDLKPGPVSEKNWGLFDPYGKPVYILHLTDSGSVWLMTRQMELTVLLRMGPTRECCKLHWIGLVDQGRLIVHLCCRASLAMSRILWLLMPLMLSTLTIRRWVGLQRVVTSTVWLRSPPQTQVCIIDK